MMLQANTKNIRGLSQNSLIPRRSSSLTRPSTSNVSGSGGAAPENRLKRSVSSTNLRQTTSSRQHANTKNIRGRSQNSLIPRRSGSLTRTSTSNVSGSGGAAPENRLRRSVSSTNLRQTTSFRQHLTTPLSYKSSISPTCSSVKKDNRPISDKRWQQDQFTKVKNFFCVRNMPEIANNLRPPTLNNFVAAVNILLKTLDPKFDIRMDNYKDAIPKYLKELGYPANIPQSLMKCVNTMHTWPQVIALLSWLIDLVEFVTDGQDEYKDDYGIIYEECVYHLQELFGEYLARKQAGQQDDKWSIQTAAFKENIVRRLGIDLDELECKNHEINKLNDDVQNMEMKREQTEEKISSLTELYNQKLAEMEVLDASILPLKNIPLEIEELKISIQKIEEETLAVNSEISNMKNTVEKQSCSFEEYHELLRQVEELKHTVKLKEDYKQNWLNVIADMDMQLTEARRQLESMVHKKNSVTNRWLVKIPEVKELQLPMKGFLMPDYEKQVLQVKEKMENLLGKYKTKITKMQAIYKYSMENETNLKNHLQKKEYELQILKIKEKVKREEWETLEVQQQTHLNDLEKQCDVRKNDQKLLQEKLVQAERDLRLAQQQVADAKKRNADYDTYLENLQDDMLHFFVELGNNIVQNINEVNQMKQSISEKILSIGERLVEQYKPLVEALRKFPQ